MATEPKRAPPQTDPAEGDPERINKQLDKTSRERSGKEAPGGGNRPADGADPKKTDGDGTRETDENP